MVTCGQVQYAFTNFADMPGGPGSAPRSYSSWGVAVDGAGDVDVADERNLTIRKDARPTEKI